MDRALELLSLLYELSLTNLQYQSPQETARSFILKFLSRKSLHYGAAWKIDSYRAPYMKLSRIYSIPQMPDQVEMDLNTFLSSFEEDMFAFRKTSLFIGNDLEGNFIYFKLNDFAIFELYHDGKTDIAFDKQSFAPFLDVITQFATSLESRYSYEMLQHEVLQRKQAELSLLANEDKYRRIIDNVSLGLVEISNDGIVQFANKPFLYSTGQDLEDVLNKKASDIFNSEDEQSFVQDPTDDSNIGTNAHEVSMLDKNGEKKWAIISSAPNYDKYGELIGSIGIQLDITEEKKLRQENEFKDAQLKKLFEKSLDALVSVDSDGNIFEWSPQAETIFGFQSREIIGRPLSKTIIPEHHRKAHDEGMNNYHETGGGPVLNQRIEITGLRKDGTEFPIELTIFPLKHDKTEYFTAFVRDITEIKESRENMEKALERQKELNNMKSQFISMTSHELRTPLTTIRSNTELLNYQIDNYDELDRKKLTKNVGRIENNVDRLNHLISNILMIGKLDSDKIAFHPQSIAVSKFLKQEILADFETRGQCVNFSIIGEEYAVSLDKKLFTQIVINLVENAFKYSPNSENPPELSLSFDDKEMKIIIRDHGIGIPKEDLTKLFSTFFRASNVGNIQGSGLGLAIVKQFVELHKGQILVDSEVGEGTIFTLYFPNKKPN